MYKLDFSNPVSVYFVGIGGVSMSALAKLLAVRKSRRRPFDKGPYHDEYYPGEQCTYEEMLLQGRFFQVEDRQIRGEIEELLVELYLLQE